MAKPTNRTIPVEVSFWPPEVGFLKLAGGDGDVDGKKFMCGVTTCGALEIRFEGESSITIDPGQLADAVLNERKSPRPPKEP
jgi:hypothetical protein